MKSITVHGLDDAVYEQLRKRAEAEEKSLNKTTKALLEEALGGRTGARGHREAFMDLFGCWSEEDLREFERATADLRQVDLEDWR